MNETFIPTLDYGKKKWYIIDCKEKQLGRLSSVVVSLLTGKSKYYYNPSLDLGDYVILVNAEYILLNRNIEKFHVFIPGRPGRSLKRLVNLNSEQILKRCIFSMMPKGIPKRQLAKRLKIYQSTAHPHLAQNPIEITDLQNIKFYE
uniref:Large ribosomal subunit protein uL13c n=1 Tax=Toxarium undulatum TaxID=210620 RepID=A0A1D8D9N6_9STRA|nr:ribosomal protein L13 [Toxarium undulatum]AOS86668.1 ribosomal protein L13 [Toxarium undulatum]